MNATQRTNSGERTRLAVGDLGAPKRTTNSDLEPSSVRRGADRYASACAPRIRAAMKIFLYLTLPLYLLDQITKNFVLRFIDLSDPNELVPNFFTLVHVTNTGAAFGYFRNNNLFFVALSALLLSS